MIPAYHSDLRYVVENNKEYRNILYTLPQLQIVAMSIKPGDGIELESHENVQFFLCQGGIGIIRVYENELVREMDIYDGISVCVPSSTPHRVLNTSVGEDLKLLTLYSPAHHKV